MAAGRAPEGLNACLEHAYHPEPKSAGVDGTPCGKETVGVLTRRHVVPEALAYIGKEANKLEQVDAGFFNDEDEVYVTYRIDAETKQATAVQRERRIRCPGCGSAFVTVDKRQKTCSKRCRERVRRGRSGAELRHVRPKR